MSPKPTVAGTAPTAKHADPIMNRLEMRSGALVGQGAGAAYKSLNPADTSFDIGT